MAAGDSEMPKYFLGALPRRGQSRWILYVLCPIIFVMNLFLLGSNVPIARQAQIKLEVVLFMYLWSIDIDAGESYNLAV